MIYITSFLSRKIKQWSILCQVSHRWQQIQKSDQAIAILQPRCLLTDLRYVLAPFPKLRFLDIESQYRMSYGNATVIALLANQKELRSLSFKMNYLPPLKRILTALPHLHSLSLSGYLRDVDVISSLHQLKYLRLVSRDKIDNITTLCLSSLTNLQGLHLSLPLLTDDGIVSLFSLPPENVRYITLSYCESLTTKTLQRLLIFTHLQRLKLKTLESLKLSYEFDLYDYHMSIICQKITRLRKLALIANKLTDEGIKYISHLSSLTSLKLNSSPISDQAMQVISQLTTLTKLGLISNFQLKNFAFLRTLLDLEFLDCRGCLFDDDAAKNVMYCPKLTHLNLGCQWSSVVGISNETVKDIISQLSRLTFLDLSFTRITGYCLPYLAQLSRLKTLDLSETDIDKKDHITLDYLSHIKNKIW